MNGIIIIDKPLGITSHDVVARIRRICGAKKVGHGGTLDPFATGVLPILINSATRLSQEVMDGDKEYIAVLKLGEATDTDDLKGKVIKTAQVPENAEEIIHAAAARFTGKINQIPPTYSAIKHNGCPHYKLARRGIMVERRPREVEIFGIEIMSIELPFVTMRVKCSKGTYIRAIARDMGEFIGSCAHLTALKRTACGRFLLKEAYPLEKLSTLQDIISVLGEAHIYGITDRTKK